MLVPLDVLLFMDEISYFYGTLKGQSHEKVGELRV
jgi:hypothetical protein